MGVARRGGDVDLVFFNPISGKLIWIIKENNDHVTLMDMLISLKGVGAKFACFPGIA
jgi:hypothetical protein